MTPPRLAGTHHVSALTADTTRNLAFYLRVLGLRLVKRTVNQDDPSMYHLFYADQVGSAGTDMTFFDFPRAARWRPGAGAHARTSFRVTGEDALAYWQERLAGDEAAAAAGALPGAETPADGRVFAGGAAQNLELSQVDGRATLSFTDPEGTALALVDDGGAGPRGVPRTDSPVPEAFQIQGLGYATAMVRDIAPTATFLRDGLGMVEARRYEVPTGTAHVFVMPGYDDQDGRAPAGTRSSDAPGPDREFHVIEAPDAPRARHGAGGVHHVALRTADGDDLGRWRAHLVAAGYANSGVVDRYYFQSLYVTDPNGLIVELATEGPGFSMDESLDALGESLALPPFLEPRRASIEARLHPLRLPGPRGEPARAGATPHAGP